MRILFIVRDLTSSPMTNKERRIGHSLLLNLVHTTDVVHLHWPNKLWDGWCWAVAQGCLCFGLCGTECRYSQSSPKNFWQPFQQPLVTVPRRSRNSSLCANKHRFTLAKHTVALCCPESWECASLWSPQPSCLILAQEPRPTIAEAWVQILSQQLWNLTCK